MKFIGIWNPLRNYTFWNNLWKSEERAEERVDTRQVVQWSNKADVPAVGGEVVTTDGEIWYSFTFKGSKKYSSSGFSIVKEPNISSKFLVEKVIFVWKEYFDQTTFNNRNAIILFTDSKHSDQQNISPPYYFSQVAPTFTFPYIHVLNPTNLIISEDTNLYLLLYNGGFRPVTKYLATEGKGEVTILMKLRELK